MKKIILLVLFFLFLNPVKVLATETKSNVLVIMLDDLDEPSFNQLLNANKLPNIRKYLLDKGVRFTNSFVTESICCSSRATFLTGMYSHNSGVFNVWGDEAGMKGLNNKGLLHFTNGVLTGADWFPSWLKDNDYFNGHVGKFLNVYEYGENIKPGFDYWRNITGYDSRPGMYYVWQDNNPNQISPGLYQAKYISDRAGEFIDSFTTSGKTNFFLEVTPHSPHVVAFRWDIESGSGTFDSTIANSANKIVSLNVFDPPEQEITLRKQVLTDDNNGDYTSWSADQTSSGWSAWTNNGKASALFSGTGNLPIVSFNAFVHPDINDIRQHIVRGDQANGYHLFHRDKQNGAVGSWIEDGLITAVIPQAAQKPVVNYSITNLAGTGILQYILLGDRTMGYDLYSRARVNNVWSSWVKEGEMWEQMATGASSNPITTFHANYVGNGLVDLRVVRTNESTGLQTSYFQRTQSFWNDIPLNVLGVTTMDTGVTTYQNEADLFTPTSPINTKVSANTSGELPYPELMKSLRVMADGNWPNFKPEQTYPVDLYGGKYPAGTFRAGGDPNGFTPLSSQFDLPGINFPSFNNCNNKHSFICNYWPDVNRPVIGGKTDLDYLRRQHLDRLESMISNDVLIGQIFSKLESKQLLANTLVIFTSDNGYFLGDFRLSNKQLPYEQSIRVPLIVKPPNSTLTVGVTNTNMVGNIDLAATITDYANIWQNYSTKIDGRSLKPILTNPTTYYSPWRKLLLEEYHYPRNVDVTQWIQVMAIPDLRAIRSDSNILYAEFTEDPLAKNNPPWYEFYDLNTDPYQVDNKYNNSTDSVIGQYINILSKYRDLIAKLALCKGDSCRLLDHDITFTDFHFLLQSFTSIYDYNNLVGNYGR